jgi:hypothetical protein
VANLRDESLTFVPLTQGGGPLTLALPGPPHELAESGGRIYATLGRGGLVVEVDGSGAGILRTVAVAGEPHGLALDADSLLVTPDKATSVLRIPLRDFVAIPQGLTGTTPHTVAVAAGKIYVTDSGDARLREVTSGRTAVTGALPESVAIAGSYVVTADAAAGSLSIFDAESLTPAGSVLLPGHPVRVIRVDDTTVAASLGDAGKVVVVDLKSAKVTRTIVTDARPDGLCLDPATPGRLAVVSNAASSVRIYGLTNGREVESFKTPDGPGSCLWLSR